MNGITSIQYKQAKNYRKIIAEKIPAGSIIPCHTDKGHFYKVGDKMYGSVTGKLQVLKDPSLANWKMNTACDYITGKLFGGIYKPSIEINSEELFKIISESKLHPQEIFEDAGDIGSQIHQARQDYFQQWIDRESPPPLEDYLSADTTRPISKNSDPRVVSSMRALNKFCTDTGYISIATEVLVWSDKLGVAGTLDDLGIIDGKLVLMDLKSSNQLKDTYHLQVAMYYQALIERTGLKPRECFILKTSKENGTYELEYLKDMRKLVSYAKAVVKVDEGLQFIKNNRKHDKITL